MTVGAAPEKVIPVLLRREPSTSITRSVALRANKLKSDVQPAPLHSGTTAELPSCVPAATQFNVAAVGWG